MNVLMVNCPRWRHIHGMRKNRLAAVVKSRGTVDIVISCREVRT